MVFHSVWIISAVFPILLLATPPLWRNIPRAVSPTLTFHALNGLWDNWHIPEHFSPVWGAGLLQAIRMRFTWNCIVATTLSRARPWLVTLWDEYGAYYSNLKMWKQKPKGLWDLPKVTEQEVGASRPPTQCCHNSVSDRLLFVCSSGPCYRWGSLQTIWK